MSEDEEQQRFRRLEREWQDRIGWQLLDGPHRAVGSAMVIQRQFDRIAESLDVSRPGIVVEVGCGCGHLLSHLARIAGPIAVSCIGIDVSRAVNTLPAKGLLAIRGDGEHLPFRDSSVRAVIYDGALHHLIDYPGALIEAHRVLMPGGRLVLFEPRTSPFTRLVHRAQSLVAPENTELESPIDLEYKHRFREDRILETLHRLGMRPTVEHTDFLSYPVTGCYAGFAVGRSKKLIQALIRIEERLAKLPVLGRLTKVFTWRSLITATKS